jgi:hypothetical protein
MLRYTNTPADQTFLMRELSTRLPPPPHHIGLVLKRRWENWIKDNARQVQSCPFAIPLTSILVPESFSAAHWKWCAEVVV